MRNIFTNQHKNVGEEYWNDNAAILSGERVLKVRKTILDILTDLILCSCILMLLISLLHVELLKPSRFSYHCLRFDPLWYDGFTVGSPETYFMITIDIHRPDRQKEMLELGPSSIGARSRDGR